MPQSIAQKQQMNGCDPAMQRAEVSSLGLREPSPAGWKRCPQVTGHWAEGRSVHMHSLPKVAIRPGNVLDAIL